MPATARRPLKTADPRCSDCSQRQNGLFCDLARPLLNRLDEVKNVEHYRPGEVVFYAGQRPRALFCVYSGRVKLFKVGARDEEQVTALLGPAGLTGYRAILAGECYTATAEAIETTTLCAFPPHVLLELVRESPEFAVMLLARLARDLRITQEYMMVRAQESVRQRTARFLIWLQSEESARTGPQAEPVIRMKRGEIARIVATTPETLSRVLHELARKGLIRFARTDIVITDAPALGRVAVGSHSMS